MNQNKNNCNFNDCRNVPLSFPSQHQNKQPGLEYIMKSQTDFRML